MNQDTPILVTGGTGFAGRHLLAALLDQGYTNLHTTHFGTRPVPEVCQRPGVTVHALDLTQAESVAHFIKQLQPSEIYHLASFAAVGKSFEQAELLLKNNILLQLYLLQAVQAHATNARVLIIGSAEEYGLLPAGFDQKITEQTPLNPINPYAVTKVTQDLLAQAYFLSYNMQIVRARPFNHIGVGQTTDFVVPAFASQIVAIEKGTQKTLKVGNLTAIRDFTDVDDVIQAYILLMQKGTPGEVYNIGRGQGWKIAEVLDMLCAQSVVKIQIEEDPQRMRPSEVPYFVADSQKIRTLGWDPKIPLEETLTKILMEWREKV